MNAFIDEWIIPALEEEIKRHFKERAIIPKKYSIEDTSAIEVHWKHLEVIKELGFEVKQHLLVKGVGNAEQI